MGALPLLKASGLQTAHNPFSGVADGALCIAKNVLLFSNGVIEPRKGHRQFSYTMSSKSYAGAFFGSTLITSDAEAVYSDTGSAFSAYTLPDNVASLELVDDTLLRRRFVEAENECYFNYADFPLGALGRPYLFACPPAPRLMGVTYSGGTTNTSSIVAGTQAAFQGTWVYVADGVEVESAPSTRFVVVNPAAFTATAANVVRASNVVTVTYTDHGLSAGMPITVSSADATFILTTPTTILTATSNTFTYTHAGANGAAANDCVVTPAPLCPVFTYTTPFRFPGGADFYTYMKFRLYRTAVSSASPGSDLYLAIEKAADAGHVNACAFDLVAHTVKDAALSSIPLYTNPRAEGALQANDVPPVAKDICWANSRMWYANTSNAQQASLRLLGTGSGGLQAGDTITITLPTGTFPTLTFSAHTGGLAVTVPQVYTHLTPTRNVQETLKSLAGSINQISASNWSVGPGTGPIADYIYSDNDPFGKLYLTLPRYSTDAFAVTVSRVAAWDIGSTTLTSADDARPNALYYSKPDQPEAVPLTNYLLIGAKNKQILRVLPLREKLFVFKEDGIYRVSGDEPFSVDLLDATTRLVSPDTACVLNNQIIAFTNQGVVAVSDAGVQILSRPIEDQLLPYLNASMRPIVTRHAFAVAHETDRTYELWLPGAAADAQSCTKAFVFSPITQTWTTWEVATGRTWGGVSPTDVRYYGGLDGKILEERRDSASSDYADETISVTVSNYGGTALTLSSTSGIEVGDCFTVSKAGGEQTTPISAIDGNVITVGEAILTQFQTGGTTIVEKGFDCEVKWTPIAFDRPGSTKRFQYGTYHYARPTAFTQGYATYSTEQSGADTDETLTRSTNGWGSNAWGATAWGDPQTNFNVRHIIPMEKQRAAMLSPGFRIREARAGWRLLGLTLDTEETSERNSRG